MTEKYLGALLKYGYFPKELPTVFTTDDFGRFSTEIIDEWQEKKIFSIESNLKVRVGNKRRSKQSSYKYKLPNSDMEVISKPKRGYERRNINITHPIPQALLAKEIAYNWKSIQRHLLKNRYCLDNIQINKSGARALKEINFRVHQAKKRFIEATCNWVVRTDITRFYPSIYTHSIAWAMYGKENVKAQMSVYDGALADRLDCLVRASNRNQTIGIPIGPETSRIIAEIISCDIDTKFFQQHPNEKPENIDRLQDDWFIGTDTLEQAESLLSSIARVYREFGLEINGSKTSIDHILAQSGTPWVAEIDSFLSHGPKPLSGARLREFLDLTLRLQSANQDSAAVSYSLAVIRSRNFNLDDIELLESFLLKAAILAPIAMDRICTLLINIQVKLGNLALKRVGARMKSLAEQNLENGNLYEAMWQIYTLRGLKIKSSSRKIAEGMEIYSGAAIPLILLDMQANDLFLSKLPVGKWEAAVHPDTILTDPIWLLGYEGIRKGWLADINGSMSTPFFDAMNQRDVVFYDPTRNVPRIRRGSLFKKRMQERAAVTSLLNALRGITGGVMEY